MATKSNGNDTIIAQGVRVEGEFVSEGDVHIEGEVVGRVQTNQNLRVGESAKIQADISAQNAVIAGEIHGDVKVKGSLELLPSSQVFGDIETEVISIASGAKVNGHIKMGSEREEKRNGRGKNKVMEMEESPEEIVS